MINRFSIKNYKCYDQNSHFQLPGLTLVSGTNNSGKSSFLQAINLLAQNSSRRYPVMTINGEMNLGSFSKILSKSASNQESIKIGYEIDKSILENFDILFLDCYYEFISANEYQELTTFGFEDYPVLNYLEINYTTAQSEDLQSFVFKLMDLPDKYIFEITNHKGEFIGYSELPHLTPTFIMYEDLEMSKTDIVPPMLNKLRWILSRIDSNNIHYIKALRLQDFDSRHQMLDNQKIGISGEYTAEIIHRNWEKKIDFLENGEELLFKDVFNKWITLMLGSQFSIYSKKVENDKYKIVIEEKSLNIEFSLDEVGFGISQILPIITMMITSKNNDLILIENPEVHCHPNLQSIFLDFCLFVAKHDRKIIIETHSEHMVNRLRLNIKKNNELLNLTNVYFFEKNEFGTSYTDINIDNLGRLEYWPKDFFDQSYHDLLGLVDDE